MELDISAKIRKNCSKRANRLEVPARPRDAAAAPGIVPFSKRQAGYLFVHVYVHLIIFSPGTDGSIDAFAEQREPWPRRQIFKRYEDSGGNAT